jgi:hypothetical protein
MSAHQGILPKKVSIYCFWPFKDDLVLKVPYVFSTCCEYRMAYFEWIGHFVETEVKEHHCHIFLNHLEKLVMCERNISLDCCILLIDMNILASNFRHMDRIIGEITEMKLQTNRHGKVAFSLMKGWNRKFIPRIRHILPLAVTSLFGAVKRDIFEFYLDPACIFGGRDKDNFFSSFLLVWIHLHHPSIQVAMIGRLPVLPGSIIHPISYDPSTSDFPFFYPEDEGKISL